MDGIRGNIWSYDGIIVIPTNTTIKKDGLAVMGAGLAKQAAKKYPDLPKLLAYKIKQDEEGTFDFPELGLVCVPTKRDWRDKSDPKLIKYGCKQLALLAKLVPQEQFYVPLLGCGLGGLSWKKDVRPIIINEFGKLDNITIVKQ